MLPSILQRLFELESKRTQYFPGIHKLIRDPFLPPTPSLTLTKKD